MFYECFAPIRLEYLVGFKGPDPSLSMISSGLDWNTDGTTSR